MKNEIGGKRVGEGGKHTEGELQVASFFFAKTYHSWRS